MVELKDVNEFLAENGLGPADLPFLSTTSGRIGLVAFQPKGDIIAAPESLGVEGKAEIGEQMACFLALAKEQNADFATCPEYACPWDAIIRSVEANTFPRLGALWSVGCESITPDQLDLRAEQLASFGVHVVRSPLLPGSGRFVNLVCHLFHANGANGEDVKVVLLQAKTAPMGGTVYERDALICGRLIFRFGKPDENRLVCLICSDVLSTEFDNAIVPELQTNTLVVHLQLNADSAAAGFREYRNRCCYVSPRTTEILCLNWAAGTRLKMGTAYKELVAEPKSIYYRTLMDIEANDKDIIDNHKKGCFLAYWEPMRTAAFIFHPDPQVFQFKISKPLMVGAAPGAKRTAPKMEARYEWINSGWVEPANDADDKFGAYMATNQEAAPHLTPYIDRHVDLERLIQLSTGFVLAEKSFDWTELRSFRLADDDTSSRLRLCWSSSGGGAVHRGECQRRFKALALVISDTTRLPVRLASFSGENIQLTYEEVPKFRRFRNLVVGDKRGTVVFLGADPDIHALDQVKDQLTKRLFDYNEDRYILSVLYRDASGVLKDHMDALPPAINDDPGIDPADIFNT